MYWENIQEENIISRKGDFFMITLEHEQQIITPEEPLEKGGHSFLFEENVDIHTHILPNEIRITSGKGEQTLPHNRRRTIISIEEDIASRRKKITILNDKLTCMNVAFRDGSWSEDMEERREFVLFERRTLSSDQAFARKEIRPYKTLKLPNE